MVLAQIKVEFRLINQQFPSLINTKLNETHTIALRTGEF